MEDSALNKWLVWGSLTLALFAGFVWAENNKTTTTGKTNISQIERGKYLVDGVGKCSDCHTPFTDKGMPDESKLLQGAPIMFKPTVEIPWAEVAPGIAGLPMLSQKDAVAFLMTGKMPDGSMPRPPMPQYRLNKADAEAVVAYLKSLE